MMSETSISLDTLSVALGHTLRLRALRELASGDALMTVQLAERMGVKQGTIGSHLRLLLANGFVTQNRAGQYAIPAGCLVSSEERILDYGTCLLRLGQRS
jgi:DNA-binding transcriptional ArsR family regulator